MSGSRKDAMSKGRFDNTLPIYLREADLEEYTDAFTQGPQRSRVIGSRVHRDRFSCRPLNVDHASFCKEAVWRYYPCNTMPVSRARFVGVHLFAAFSVRSIQDLTLLSRDEVRWRSAWYPRARKYIRARLWNSTRRPGCPAALYRCLSIPTHCAGPLYPS